MSTLRPQTRLHGRLAFAFASLLATSVAPPVLAGTFIWNNATGNWSDGSKWQGGSAPTGASASDVLVFGGDVGTTAGTAPNYTATNEIPAAPFLLNAFTLNATDAAGLATDPPHIIAGNGLRLTGTGAVITQNGAGPVTFNLPAQLIESLLFAGNGTGAVTFNMALSGFATLHKTGTSTFRFGTFPILPATTAPSDNTWIGALLFDDGTIRFNNNADSGRTALRSNSIVFPASGAATPLLTCTSELRAGVLSGGIGKVESAVTGTNLASEDIVITALSAGSFAGTVRLGPPTGTGSSLGKLVARGPGAQTLTGTLQIDKDLDVSGTLIFAGTAALGTQTKGALVLSGGTFKLDNTATNNTDRLRNATSTSTGLDPIGGGIFQLIGNSAANTTETIGRVQLAAQTGAASPFRTKARAGELRIGVVHRSGASFATALTLQGYERDATSEPPLDTVEFSATDGAGAALNLGSTGNNPRIAIATLPIPLSNGLFDNNTGSASTGWAVTRTTIGLAFATQTAVANGVSAVATTATWTSDTNANVLLSGSQSIPATAFSLHSLRILPGAGQSLSIAATGTLDVKGIILTGANDFSITGAGALAGATPRYVFVDTAPLALTLGVDVGNTAPLVKGGDGTLILTSTANPASTQTFAINRGVVRSALNTLPGGELRLRGGVLEIAGGGTFNRPLLDGTGISAPGTVNWSNVQLIGTVPAPTKTDADRGSGGFAAIGANVIVDLAAPGATPIAWEDKGFVQSGHALVLGSRTATAKVTLLDNVNLTSADITINFNAREIRADDNPASSADRAVIAGAVSGTVHNDLLKTGSGTLELAAANTFAGMAFVQAGTLVVSGSTSGIGVEVMSGATLAGGGATTSILLDSGAALAPGDSTTATLTGTGLTWKAGAICRFDLGAAGASDRIALGGGALTKNGEGTFAFDFGGGGQNGQLYTLATFGSTSFSAADFSAANLAAGVTGTFQISAGQLQFSTIPPSPLETWRQLYFGPGATNAGIAADTADPDNDGLKNLHEYVLLGHPQQPSTTVLPRTGRAGNSATFTFIRNTNATDVTLRVEASDTLATGSWTTVATRVAGGAGWTSVDGFTAVENGAGAVTVTDSADITLTPKRFLRLIVVH